MRRYWFDSLIDPDQVLSLDGDLFHHVFGVCRQEVQSQFELISPDGVAHLVQVTQVGKKSAQVKCLSQRIIPPLKKPWIHLALSICRYPVMDAIIEKSVELGIKEFHPFVSEFSQVRSVKDFPMDKLFRWQKIIKMASQQSGRGDLLTVNDPIPLKNLLEMVNQKPLDLGLFAYEGTGGLPLKDFLRSKTVADQSYDSVWLFVGSEGGFSHKEVESFRSIGLNPVTIGEQVLRVETACIAILSVLKYEFELMR